MKRSQSHVNYESYIVPKTLMSICTIFVPVMNFVRKDQDQYLPTVLTPYPADCDHAFILLSEEQDQPSGTCSLI